MAHIPSGTTAEMELVTFQQALEAANTPSPEYDIENVNARDNLIKILILAGEKCEKEKLIKYDIVMNANGSPNSPDTYKINNLNNLAEELISLLYSHF